MTTSCKKLPDITLSAMDIDRLEALASAAASSFPLTAEFLAREIGRATVAPSGFVPPGLVVMGSRVAYRDDTTGQTRSVILVYPDQADMAAGKISVLSPVGAALIGLNVGQTIEWETPAGESRSLTVLSVGV